MSNTILFSAATFLSMTLALFAQPSRTILGNWEADKEGFPWVTVNVTRGGNGKFSGTAVFYVFDNPDSQGSPKVLGKQEVQLVDPQLVGDVFSFKIKNEQREVTMNPSSGETLSFQMILTDETHATLKSGGPRTAEATMVKKE
jgi:hypothetical protein